MNNDNNLFRQALQRQNERAADMKMPDDMEQQVMERIHAQSSENQAVTGKDEVKPQIALRRWLFPISIAAIAACFLLLVIFHFGKGTSEQTPLIAEKNAAPTDSVQPKQEVIIPTEVTEEAVMAQATPVIHRTHHPETILPVAPKEDSASTAEALANCIARLEAEMENLDDSISAAHLEKLIAADARLQQMVNRIVGKQVERARNEIQKDSTANYINF